MMGYIRENSDCSDYNKVPSKKLIKRYMIRTDQELIHWYLLEKYYEGKITITEDEKPLPKSGTASNS